MPRGIGEIDGVTQLPEWAVALAGVVTQLGDMWFVLVAISAVYVVSTRTETLSRSPHRDCLILFGLAVGAYSLTVALKAVFALPRPPDAGTATSLAWLPAALHPVYESFVTGSGYGFPSGHALKTTAVYGGGAVLLSVWNFRRRLVAAGIVSVLVSASRVVLGVHYVVDVVVGTVVGVVLLLVVVHLSGVAPGEGTSRTPQSSARRVLVAATVLGLAGFGLTIELEAGLAVVGAVLGAAYITVRDWDGTVETATG